MAGVPSGLEERARARTGAQRETKEKLRASALRFRTMVDAIFGIVWMVDAVGRGVYSNRSG